MPVVLPSVIIACKVVEFSEPSPMGKGTCLKVGMNRSTVLKGDTVVHGELLRLWARRCLRIARSETRFSIF